MQFGFVVTKVKDSTVNTVNAYKLFLCIVIMCAWTVSLVMLEWSEYHTVRNIIYSHIYLFIKNTSHYTCFNNQYCVIYSFIFLCLQIVLKGMRLTYFIWSLIKCVLDEAPIINVKRKDVLLPSPLPSSCQVYITMILKHLACDRENKWCTKSVAVRNRKSNLGDIVDNMQSSQSWRNLGRRRNTKYSGGSGWWLGKRTFVEGCIQWSIVTRDWVSDLILDQSLETVDNVWVMYFTVSGQSPLLRFPLFMSQRMFGRPCP